MTTQSCKPRVVAAAVFGIVSIGSLVANGPGGEADNGTIWSAKHGTHTTWSVDTAPGAVAKTVAVATNTGSDVDTAVRDHGDSSKGSVWVVNRDLGELAVFDAETGAVISTMAVGAGAHDICISEQVHKAYITAETINTVTTVDTRTLATESIGVGPLPHHIEPSNDGHTIYVSLASHTATVGSPQLAVIDTDDNSVTFIGTSSNPAARSHGPYPSADGGKVYVAHDLGNELSRIDVETGDIDFSITPIPRAEEVIPTRSGSQLWVSSRGDGTVKRIDLNTHTVDSVSVGVQPESVMLTPSERTLVVSLAREPGRSGLRRYGQPFRRAGRDRRRRNVW